jgi:uncharacterized protein (DUF362 family)/NAD-dependent dihydropyrimidine dehydrogenase PreA subunit
MKSTVVLIRCDSYKDEAVERAVQRGIELMGGAEKFVFKNEKIILKPNLLAGDAPEKCTTTHPALLKAVVAVFRKTGAHLSYGDSPSFGSLARTAKVAGLAQIAEELHLPAADFDKGKEIFFKEGRQNKKFVIANAVLTADGIISLPKLKAHGFQKMTGCIKNQFGCIPGPLKAEFHFKLVDSNDFARMLLDLNCLVRPRLFIMDAIQAMEGNGPRGGTPKQMNLLLFSKDPVALDATACRLMDMDPELVPTIRFGPEFELGTFNQDEIDILGDSLEECRIKDFKIDRAPLSVYRTMGVRRRLTNLLVPKPFIVSEKCTQCGTCISVCPSRPKTLSWKKGNHSIPPVYDYHNCIRCYCCQELCPEGAIKLRTPIVRKIINMFPKKK